MKKMLEQISIKGHVRVVRETGSSGDSCYLALTDLSLNDSNQGDRELRLPLTKEQYDRELRLPLTEEQ